MAYLTTYTLDDLMRPRIMESKIEPSGRLDDIDRRVRRGFLVVLATYLAERGTGSRFEYIVTDSDFDTVVDMIKQGLPT